MMAFADMALNMRVQHRNGWKATVIDIDKELNPAFRILWDKGTAVWYSPETAESFTFVR